MSLKRRFLVAYVRTKFKLLSTLSKRKAAEQAFELFCTPQGRNRKELPPIFEEAKKLQILFHGAIIRGYQWNPLSEHKVLVLHGFESSVVNFEKYIKLFIKKGYEVLAFDALAHGRSDGKTINVLLYKELIQTILQLFGPVKLFMAHSFGGLAISLVLEDMEHDASYKAALIAPATETTTAIDYFFRFLKLDAGLRTYFDEIIEKRGHHLPEWFSILRAAKNIKAQVLWIHDKEDDLTPWADAEKVQAMNYPNFTFYVTEGLGHRRIYRDKKIVNLVVDYL